MRIRLISIPASCFALLLTSNAFAIQCPESISCKSYFVDRGNVATLCKPNCHNGHCFNMKSWNNFYKGTTYGGLYKFHSARIMDGYSVSCLYGKNIAAGYMTFGSKKFQFLNTQLWKYNKSNGYYFCKASASSCNMTR